MYFHVVKHFRHTRNTEVIKEKSNLNCICIWPHIPIWSKGRHICNIFDKKNFKNCAI
jgi:hypothetical protein